MFSHFFWLCLPWSPAFHALLAWNVYHLEKGLAEMQRHKKAVKRSETMSIASEPFSSAPPEARNECQVCSLKRQREDRETARPAWLSLKLEPSIFTFSFVLVSSVQFSRSVMSDSLQSHGQQHARPPYHQLPELAQTHVHWVGDTIQPFSFGRPLLLPPAIFPSTRVLSNESAVCIRWPKYWSSGFIISPSNE